MNMWVWVVGVVKMEVLKMRDGLSEMMILEIRVDEGDGVR